MVRTGEVQSLLEIARSMDISPDMALQIMQELTKKGYLEEIGTDCEQPQKGCSDCPLNSTCQETVRRWFLTEKGRSVISSM
jgi:DNA-binding Lrp family transcriptional regulator